MADNYLKKELYKLIKTDDSIFDFIQEGSLDGLWYWDLEKPENEWMNARFWTVLGYNPDEMPHKSSAWQSIINQEDLKAATENFVKHCENPNHPYDQIVRYTHKDGSTKWIRCRGLAIRDASGKPIRMLGAHQDVTGFKQAEEAVLQKTNLISSLLDGIPDLVFFKDTNGVYLGCNPHFAEFVGNKREEIVGKTDYDLFDRATADFFRHNDNEMLKLLKTRHNNEWITYADGRRVYADTIKTPYYNQHGELIGVLGITRDITDRYHIEQENRIFKIMSDNAVEGKAIADLEGNIVYINKFFADIHGYKQEELVGQHLTVFHSPQQLETVGAALASLFECGYFEPQDIGHVHRNGTAFPMLMSGTVINDSSGNPQYISATAIDITERKAAEKELEFSNAQLKETTKAFEQMNFSLMNEINERTKAEQELKESEEKLRIILKTMDEGVAVYTDKEIKFANAALCRLLGYSENELVNKDTESISVKIIHPDDLSKVNSAAAACLSNENMERMEYRYVNADGDIIWVSGIPAIISWGSERAIIATVVDITRHKIAQKELEKHSLLLESSNKELEAFSYSVSHDLRAPLRHINGYIEILNKRFGSELPEKAQNYLQTITGASQKMGKLIDDLLQYSRIGRQGLRKIEVDMNLLVEELIEELKAGVKGRKINWKKENLNKVYADYTLIRQVWANLLENAIKYTSKKETAEITVGLTENTHEYVFYVCDNGEGFDMKYAHKLFGVFQRLHSETEFEGTGIGLANVQRIVHKHQGRVWVEAEHKKGATFYFTTPKIREENL